VCVRHLKRRPMKEHQTKTKIKRQKQQHTKRGGKKKGQQNVR